MIESRIRFAAAWLCSALALLTCAACKSEKNGDPATADSAQALAPGVGENDEQPGHKGKRELPSAAFDACQGKGVGDACTVTFGEKPIEAKCAAAPDGRLACRPERGERKKPE